MRLPAIRGLIKRRVLVNYRTAPAAFDGFLPAPFRPRLVDGHAMAGLCLIRLERVRPAAVTDAVGLASENVAYRVAVEWTDPQSGEEFQGVYIPRRDTSSSLQHALGGRVFPGVYGLATFEVADEAGHVSIRVRSADGGGDVELEAVEGGEFATTSVFPSLTAASRFFQEGSIGYSAGDRPDALDGLLLDVEGWAVKPLTILSVRSSFIDRLPVGSSTLDNALVMRDVPHRWRALPAIRHGQPPDRPVA